MNWAFFGMMKVKGLFLLDLEVVFFFVFVGFLVALLFVFFGVAGAGSSTNGVASTTSCSEDERESMISYSTTLLKYQIETVTEQHEIEYLDRCNAEGRLKKGLAFLGKK